MTKSNPLIEKVLASLMDSEPIIHLCDIEHMAIVTGRQPPYEGKLLQDVLRTALTEVYNDAFASGVESVVIHSVETNVEKIRTQTIEECVAVGDDEVKKWTSLGATRGITDYQKRLREKIK